MDSNEKNRGYFLHKCPLPDPDCLSMLMVAARLAYLWVLYLGLTVVRRDQVEVIHRADQCNWSLFRSGLAWLDYLHN